MTRWVALLRGVNVGGNNRLSMADLRATAAGSGFTNVATHIQSGNLVLDGPDDEDSVVESLRAALVERHGLSVAVVVRSDVDFASVVERHPDVAGTIAPNLLHVAFLDRSPEADVVDAIEADRFAPDRWSLDGRELYLSYPNGSARSTMTIDRFERPWDVVATARNLNTVRKIAAIVTGS